MGVLNVWFHIELPDFFDQVGYKWFQNISAGLYIVYIWFISYKMRLVELRCAAVKRFIVVLRWLAYLFSEQREQDNNNAEY